MALVLLLPICRRQGMKPRLPRGHSVVGCDFFLLLLPAIKWKRIGDLSSHFAEKFLALTRLAILSLRHPPAGCCPTSAMPPCRDPPLHRTPRPSASAKAPNQAGELRRQWSGLACGSPSCADLNHSEPRAIQTLETVLRVPQHPPTLHANRRHPFAHKHNSRHQASLHLQPGTVAPLCTSALLRRLFACMLDPQIRNRGRREEELHRPHTSGTVGPHFQANTVNRPSVGRVGVKWTVGGFVC